MSALRRSRPVPLCTAGSGQPPPGAGPVRVSSGDINNILLFIININYQQFHTSNISKQFLPDLHRHQGRGRGYRGHLYPLNIGTGRRGSLAGAVQDFCPMPEGRRATRPERPPAARRAGHTGAPAAKLVSSNTGGAEAASGGRVPPGQARREADRLSSRPGRLPRWRPGARPASQGTGRPAGALAPDTAP